MKKIFILLSLVSLNMQAQTVNDSIQKIYNRAALNIQFNNDKEALKLAEIVIKADSTNCKYLMLLRTAQSLNNQNREAMNTAYRIFYNCKDTIRFYSYMEISYSSLKMLDSAEYYITKKIELKKDSASLYRSRALYRLRMDNKKGYIEDLTKAVELGDKTSKSLLDLEK